MISMVVFSKTERLQDIRDTQSVVSKAKMSGFYALFLNRYKH